jgi:DNA-binding response OmpR family regulator
MPRQVCLQPDCSLGPNRRSYAVAMSVSTHGRRGQRVLVVDDDADIRTVLAGVYERAGFDVETVDDGRAALRALFDRSFDLVVLDLGLPGLDGMTVLGRLREMTDLPVLVLTARGLENDKVSALTAGADDYLTKPFSNGELLARSIALLRRASQSSSINQTVDDGTVRMDLGRREAWVDGVAVRLTPTDWNLLLAFVHHPEHVLSPEQLLELAWHDPFGIGPDRVKFAVLRLRRRAGWEDVASSPLQAVRGFGYRYRPRP